jgi:hypothetical protein
MKKIVIVISLFLWMIACTRESSNADESAQAEEMEAIEQDALKTMEEIEAETEELEAEVDSLLREI